MTCYYPDGSVSLDTPCNQRAKNSHCCPPESSCLDNGYCFSGPSGPRYQNVVARSSCTDKTFQDAACPVHCSDTNTNAGQILIPFYAGQNGTTEALFCCGPPNFADGNCQYQTLGQNAAFQLANGLIITDRTTGESKPYNQSSPSSLDGSVVTASTGNNNGRGGSDTAAIAAGIAVPLVVLLLVALIALGLQTYRFKQYRKSVQSERESLVHRTTEYAKIDPDMMSEHRAELDGGAPMSELSSIRK